MKFDHTKLEQLRREHKISRNELAKQIEVGYFIYEAWEKGYGVPSYYDIQAIAHVFNTTIQNLENHGLFRSEEKYEYIFDENILLFA